MTINVNVIAIALGVIATVTHLAAYSLYMYNAHRHRAKPNSACWTVWAVVSVINVVTYFAISKDLVTIILPTFSSLTCVAAFLYALFRRKLKPLQTLDKQVLGIAGMAVIVWAVFRSAANANVLLQVSETISFVPQISDVRKDPKAEPPLPWFLWSAGYVLLIAVLLLKFDGDWMKLGYGLVYPLNLFVFHGIVGIIAVFKKPATT